MRRSILLCDDDNTLQLAFRHLFRDKYDVKTAFHGDEAVAILKNNRFDLMLLDINLRKEGEGLDYVSKFREIDPDLSIVVLSGVTDFETVRRALRLGALDYIPKDTRPEDLLHAIDRVFEKRELLRAKSQQSSENLAQHRRHELIGRSAAVENLRRVIERAKRTNANVVITGETGVGKEVVARSLRHTDEDGSLVPFVSVDSSTIQSTTAESILFGHEKGAFTGADKVRKGVFEEADGGIVYFDEIVNMTLEIQSKLLRVIQEKEVTRMGSAKTIPLEFRVIAATNKRLEELIKLGLFKDDLYQRLNVIPIHVPSLRERKEDIPDLLSHFAKKHCPEDPISFGDETIEVLMAYEWPGNIRELGNLVAYLTTMCDHKHIEIADLPPKIRDFHKDTILAATTLASAQVEKTGNGEERVDFYKSVGEFEAALIRREYDRVGGNVSRLALNLGMDRSHLYSKLKAYGIHSPSNQRLKVSL